MVTDTMKRSRRRQFDSHECPVCGWPSATKRGMEQHRRMSHGDNPFAERNWEIFTDHVECGVSVAALAREHHLAQVTVRRIIWRGLAFPGIYDLEEK